MLVFLSITLLLVLLIEMIIFFLEGPLILVFLLRFVLLKANS